VLGQAPVELGVALGLRALGAPGGAVEPAQVLDHPVDGHAVVDEQVAGGRLEVVALDAPGRLAGLRSVSCGTR